VPAGDALGTVRIDKLDADYVMVQSTTGAALRKGPGHYSETPLPGEDGNVGIAGHRTTYEAPFRHIDDLKAGDKVTVKMPYGLFTYTVERQRIVPAGYKAAFADAGSGEHLVLSACHPLYSASQRILVYARLTGAQPLGAAIERTPAATGPTAREVALQRRAARLKALGKRTLVIGMTGSDVKELQRLLGLPASGTFGPETNAAVLEFQRTHGLPVVGSVGSQTKAKLARRPHPPSRPPTPPDVPRQQPVQPGQGQSTVPGQQPNGQYTQPGYGTGTTQPPAGQQSP
jgi:LPXTG-site transpeptidase (sortase) family protein